MIQFSRYLLVFILFGYPLLSGANASMVFNPVPLHQKMDEIKTQIRVQRQADQHLIRQAEIMYQQITAEVRATGESRTIPSEYAQNIIDAREREEARSGNCFENHPFKVISKKTFESCDFGSINLDCSNSFIFDRKKTFDLLEKKNNLLGENVLQTLKSFRQEAFLQINKNKQTINQCSQKLNSQMNLCKPLYEMSLTPQIIDLYINTCTEESLDQQVIEYSQLMEREQSVIQDMNDLRRDIAKAIELNGKLSEALVEVHKTLEAMESGDTKQMRKPGKTINLAQLNQCPTSICNSSTDMGSGSTDFETQTGFVLTPLSVNIPAINLPTITLPEESTCTGDDCGGGNKQLAHSDVDSREVEPVAQNSQRLGESYEDDHRPSDSNGMSSQALISSRVSQQTKSMNAKSLPRAQTASYRGDQASTDSNSQQSFSGVSGSTAASPSAGVSEPPTDLSPEEIHDLQNAQDKLNGNIIGPFEGSAQSVTGGKEEVGKKKAENPIINAVKGLASKLGLDHFFGASQNPQRPGNLSSLDGSAKRNLDKKSRMAAQPLKDPRAILQERLNRYKRNLATAQDGITGPHSKIFRNVCLHYKEFAYQEGLESHRGHCPNE